MKLNLKDDERIITVLRATKLTLIWPFLVSIILTFLPVFLFIPLWSFGLSGVMLFWFSIGVGLAWTFKKFFLWRRNQAVITTRRIIDIFQKKFFDVVVSEAGFIQIDDISFRKKGLLEHLFNYGTITLRLENSKVALELRRIRKPEFVRALLADLRSAILESDVGTMEKMIEKFKILDSSARKALLHALGALESGSAGDEASNTK